MTDSFNRKKDPLQAVASPPSGPVERSSSLRVLLVHANPFQRATPVPPYGLERIRTAAQGAATIEILDPYLVSEQPVDMAVAVAKEMRPDVIGLGIRVLEDCIVIDHLLDEPDAGPFDVTWFMPEIRRLRDALGEAVPDALFVLGGAAFSAMPRECLDYLEVEYGVVGAGEAAFRSLLERLAAGESLTDIPGLVDRRESSPLRLYSLAIEGPTRREPFYAPTNSFPVRTRIGCAMQCVYCLTANVLRQHADGDVELVVQEVEAVVKEAEGRGIPRVQIFFADDEFNLPDERHPLAILNELRERRLHKKIRWRAYFNPTPFSDEFAALIKETNGHASITVDSAAESVMVRAQKPFRRRHLDALIERLQSHRVSADLGLIFGLPGETEQTLAETIEFVRSLPAEIEVAYSTGARVYPNTPLAAIAEKEPEWLLGSHSGSFFEPVVYSSPVPPRELARRLADAFADLEHVRPVGVGFGSARTTMADGYRAMFHGTDKAAWQGLLTQAEEPGDYQRSPPESLGALIQLAVWHSRFDLAAAGCKRLANQRELPDGASRNQLRLARLVYGAMAGAQRLKRVPRRPTAARGVTRAT